MTLLERYRTVYARLWGFKDHCDEQHNITMRELEKELKSLQPEATELASLIKEGSRLQLEHIEAAKRDAADAERYRWIRKNAVWRGSLGGSERDAKQAAWYLRQRQPDAGWLTPYRCQFCRGFHYGHPPKRVRQSIAAHR